MPGALIIGYADEEVNSLYVEDTPISVVNPNDVPADKTREN